MRTFLFAFATTAIVFTAGTVQVGAHDYRYCLQGEEFGAGDCKFTTLQQCEATASGRMASCGINFAFSNATLPDRAQSNSHHR